MVTRVEKKNHIVICNKNGTQFSVVTCVPFTHNARTQAKLRDEGESSKGEVYTSSHG